MMDEDTKVYRSTCISILNEAKRRIEQDKNTFRDCGQDMTVVGHSRALMILDEMIEELKR